MEHLAKFGYLLDMKIEKMQNPSWLTTGTYHKNLEIWKFSNLKSQECGPFFCMKTAFQVKI
jgi:hypothetical protein